MSVTIEDVMSLVDAYIGLCGVGTENDFDHAEHKLRAALLALVAQARDEEAEACAEIVMAEQATPHGIAYCEAAIRARIAGRKA